MEPTAALDLGREALTLTMIISLPILMVGLVIAVGLMGIAANIIAKYIERYRWIAWVGLLVILYVASTMIYTGITDQEVGLLQLFR